MYDIIGNTQTEFQWTEYAAWKSIWDGNAAVQMPKTRAPAAGNSSRQELRITAVCVIHFVLFYIFIFGLF